MTRLLDVLAVDDEAPALDELMYLLNAHPGIGDVYGVGDASAALREQIHQLIERLDEAIRRVSTAGPPEPDPQSGEAADEVIPVELAGVTQLVRRDTIGWVEADGDYARLHSASGSHLVRIPVSTLETRWRNWGFQRIHRSYLVALGMVTGLRSTDGGMVVRIRDNGSSPAVELPVSRRQTRELRDRLVRDPMRSYRPAPDDQ